MAAPERVLGRSHEGVKSEVEVEELPSRAPLCARPGTDLHVHMRCSNRPRRRHRDRDNPHSWGERPGVARLLPHVLASTGIAGTHPHRRFSCLVRLLLDWYRCTSRPACFSTMARASASLCIISTSHMHVQPRWQRGRPCCLHLASAYIYSHRRFSCLYRSTRLAWIRWAERGTASGCFCNHERSHIAFCSLDGVHGGDGVHVCFI